MQLYSFPSLRIVMGHALAWLSYVGLLYVFNSANPYPLTLVQSVYLVFLFALVFYPVMAVLYCYVKRKRYLLGATVVLGYLGLVLPTLYFFMVYVLYPQTGVVLHLEHVAFNVKEFFKNYGIGVMRFSLYAGIYYAVDMRIAAERERARLELGKAEAERKALHAENEKLAFEMAALSVQVSPHLLNNILFKLYASARSGDEDHPGRLLLLGEVAAYAADATRPEDALVTVGEELEIIKTLQQLTEAHLVYADDFAAAASRIPAHVRVPRLVMVSLVENALKYSPSIAGSPPIRLALHVSKQELTFGCSNAKGKAYDLDVSAGTGLANLRRRLQIHYGEGATLETNDMPEHFEARLTIVFQ